MSEHKLTRDFDSEFPSNSNKKKELKSSETSEKVKITPVVSGKVLKQQRSFSQKVSETFFGDDTRSVMDYILHDVLIPAMKSTLSDMVGGGIEMLLFGERKSSGGRIYRDRDRSYIPYNRLGRKDDSYNDRRQLSRTARTRHDFDDIVLETRGEAEEVLTHLADLIDDYGVASVGDYYDLLGIESSFVDNKYGWTNIAEASVDRVRNGYLVRLPRPREI
jgi:hypothetical protein